MVRATPLSPDLAQNRLYQLSLSQMKSQCRDNSLMYIDFLFGSMGLLEPKKGDKNIRSVPA